MTRETILITRDDKKRLLRVLPRLGTEYADREDLVLLGEELERAVADFVHHYNFERYHESISNLTPAQVYYDKGAAVLRRRQRTKERTLRERKRNYYRQQGRRILVQKE